MDNSLIGLVNRIQRVCTALGDYGGGDAVASLWESLPTVAVVGGQVRDCYFSPRVDFVSLRKHILRITDLSFELDSLSVDCVVGWELYNVGVALQRASSTWLLSSEFRVLKTWNGDDAIET